MDRARSRGQVIRDRRNELGLSQQTLARETGVGQDRISRAEKRNESLSLTASLLIARRLGLAVEDITALDQPATVGAA